MCYNLNLEHITADSSGTHAPGDLALINFLCNGYNQVHAYAPRKILDTQ